MLMFNLNLKKTKMRKLVTVLLMFLAVGAYAQDSSTTSKTILNVDLEEVVVSSRVIDVAKERETPIAVSTISAQEVLLKVGNQEFP
jgi:hypothetical protein